MVKIYHSEKFPFQIGVDDITNMMMNLFSKTMESFSNETGGICNHSIETGKIPGRKVNLNSKMGYHTPEMFQKSNSPMFQADLV